MSKLKKGRHLDIDEFDAVIEGLMTRLRDFRDSAHRAREDANFAEMSEADYRTALEMFVQAVGGVIERHARDKVLHLGALDAALAEAARALDRLSLRAQAHYATRDAELKAREDAVAAAEAALAADEDEVDTSPDIEDVLAGKAPPPGRSAA